MNSFTFLPLWILMSVMNFNSNETTGISASTIVALEEPWPPYLHTPVSGSSINTKEVTFTWSRTGKKHVYEISISTSPDFSYAKSFGVTDTVFKFSNSEFLIGYSYYWKVRSFVSKKVYSEWSAASHFFYGMMPTQLDQGGCNRNCGSCKNPCGRRPTPVDVLKPE